MSAGNSYWEMDELRIIVGAMVILAGATGLLVVMPYMLLDNVKPPENLKPYTDTQLVGRQSYIANGCVYCHSQQPRDVKLAPDASRGC
jgi:cytochrome c oxidase cbb3-type subunit II